MFTDIGQEIIQSLINDSSANSLKYNISFLKNLDEERLNAGDTCCDYIKPSAICFNCFEHHLDRILLNKIKKVLWDKYKETV